MRYRRGQSEIVGVILLISLVLLSATAVLVVGSSVFDSVQGQSEHEHDVNELESISHEVETTIQSPDSRSELAVQSGYEASNGPHVTIEVDNNAVAYDESIGRLERNGLVYEGGLVVDAEDGRVVSAPHFDFENESTLLQFPALESPTGNFDGSITHTNTDTPIEPPEERLEIEIESEYYEQWADQFADAPASVTTHDANDTVRVVYTLESGVSSVDQALSISGSGARFDLNEMPTTEVDSYESDPTSPRANARVEAKINSTGNQGGEVHVEGEFIYEGDDPNQGNGTDKVSDTEGGPTEGDVADPYPTAEILMDTTGVEYDGDGDLDGGVFYNDDSELRIDGDTDVTAESVLIVDGDLTIGSGTTLTVAEPVDVFVHGDLTLEDGAKIETEPASEATQASVFVGGEVHAERAEFTGVLHGTDSSLAVDDEFTVYGAAVVSNVEMGDQATPDNPNQNSLEIHYDERLEDRPHPFATSGGTVRVPERKIVDVANFDEDETISGPAAITDDKSGNVLVDGHLTGIDDDVTIDGSLLVDGNVQGGIEGATITGDLLVTGKNDVAMENVDVGGDLRMVGPMSRLEDARVGGDLVVGKIDERIVNVSIDGDMRIEGPAGNEIRDVTVTKIIAYDGLSDTVAGVRVDEHLAIKNDLSNSLEGVTIDNGDLFVGGRASAGIDDLEVGNNATVRDGSPNVLDELAVGDDLMVEGRLHRLEDSDIDHDIRLTEDYGTIDNTSRNDTITDADPSTFPTFEDYLENHTDEIRLPDLAAEHARDRHAFDVRIAELEVD